MSATWQMPLVNHLTRLAAPDNPDRAALAHLRRGLGRPIAETLSRVGWLFDRVPDEALDSAVLAAGLFAWVKGDCKHTDNVDFGRAFGAGLTRDEKQQREKRFTDLLDTDADDLPYKLRQAVTLIRGTGLDWAALMTHLTHRDHIDKWVQKTWARGYWSAPATDDEPDDDETT